jgi:enoyl-[acyl-carrier protein] reductase II
MPGASENARVALEEQVPIINVSLGKSDWIADGLSQYGGKLIATVTNERHARAAMNMGADALMVTGHEAAAHGGDVTSLVLIPTLTQLFPGVPVVAAGGIANGRGLAAALALGADGVAMGSRMAVTLESPLAQTTKERIVSSSAHDTISGSNFDGIPARVLKTRAAVKLMERRPSMPVVAYRAFRAARQLNMPLWQVTAGLMTKFEKIFIIAQFGAATERIMDATVRGDVDGGVQFVGQGQSMINDIPSVETCMTRIINEAIDANRRSQTLFGADRDLSVEYNAEKSA